MSVSIVNEAIEILNSMKITASSAESNENAVNIFDGDTIETAEKLRIFKSLPIIARQVGPEETKKNLLPVIASVATRCLNVGDDEVLLVVAQKLGEFLPLVGEGENLVPVVNILEKMLYKIEEIIVAHAISASIVKLVPHMSSQLANNCAMNLVKTLVGEDLYCSSKKVLPEIMVALYPQVSAKYQQDLRFRFLQYADFEEEVPIVRVAFVTNLVPLMKAVGSDIKSEMITLVNSLVTDCERSIRAACVPVLIELGNMCVQRTEVETIIIPMLEKLAEDNCRDVKRSIARSMTDWQNLLKKHAIPHNPAKPLYTIMLNLLEDNEVETRRLSAAHLEDFCLALPQDVLNGQLIQPLKEHLVREREERVRAELVRVAVRLLPTLKRDDALPLVRHILAFLNENSAQAKQYVFEHFPDMVKMLNVNEVQVTLLPSLLRLWTDKNWRVRLGVVQSVPYLFDILQEDSLKDVVLVATLAWLRDPTWTVRECACRSLARLLRACPAAIGDAINGTGANTAKLVCAKAFGQATPDQNSATCATPTGDENGSGNMSTASIESLTFIAAKGGLEALATDTNYHLRKIYTIAIQTLWGPGIPNETPFNASGAETNMGVVNPSVNSVHHHIELKRTQMPPNCSPPVQMPQNYLAPCLQQIMRLLADDPVPNVRFNAARALFFMSGHIDKKIAQKDVIPQLKTVIANDADIDVKFYAQETLLLFE